MEYWPPLFLPDPRRRRAQDLGHLGAREPRLFRFLRGRYPAPGKLGEGIIRQDPESDLVAETALEILKVLPDRHDLEAFWPTPPKLGLEKLAVAVVEIADRSVGPEDLGDDIKPAISSRRLLRRDLPGGPVFIHRLPQGFCCGWRREVEKFRLLAGKKVFMLPDRDLIWRLAELPRPALKDGRDIKLRPRDGYLPVAPRPLGPGAVGEMDGVAQPVSDHSGAFVFQSGELGHGVACRNVRFRKGD